MLKRFIISFCISVFFLSNISLAFALNSHEPMLPPKSIFKQNIQLTTQQFRAGTAWAMGFAGKDTTVIVTALHIFGPAGGLPAPIPADKLAGSVQWAVLTDAFNGTYYGKVTKVLTIPTAQPSPNTAKDVAAYLADKSLKVDKLFVSDTAPKVNDEVWLAARVVSGAPEGARLHKATVVAIGDSALIFQFENTNLNLTATSGAPILNREGKVVGINISAGRLNGSLYGFANPATSFLPMIINALQTS